jgi:hypothetical protein
MLLCVCMCKCVGMCGVKEVCEYKTEREALRRSEERMKRKRVLNG